MVTPKSATMTAATYFNRLPVELIFGNRFVRTSLSRTTMSRIMQHLLREILGIQRQQQTRNTVARSMLKPYLKDRLSFSKTYIEATNKVSGGRRQKGVENMQFCDIRRSRLFRSRARSMILSEFHFQERDISTKCRPLRSLTRDTPRLDSARTASASFSCHDSREC